MSRRNGILIAAGACGLGLVFGYTLHVFAEGAPNPPALFYSGTLEQDGMPANGTFTVTLTLYDAERGGSELCAASSEAEVENGRFRIDASACMEVIRGEPDTWAAVSFQGSDGMTRAIEGRSKIGAVPYALEADHAVSASNAEGALAATLQELTDRVKALETEATTTASAFSAKKTTDQTIDPGFGRVVIFDDELFDFNDEYDEETGVFTTEEGGYYEFNCMIAWNIDSGGPVGQWEVGIQLNGYERLYNGFTTDGMATTRNIQVFLRLEPNDRVACTALQEAPAKPLQVVYPYNQFEGRRFAPL